MIVNIEKKSEEIGLKPEFVKMLFDAFVQESAQILKNLQEATLKKDFDAIERHAHSFKGSSGNLQLNEMYELSKSIEFAAKDKKVDFNYIDSTNKLLEDFNGLEVVLS